LRKGLGLYANLRPVWTVPELIAASPLRPEVLAGVDLVVVRELTGGIYFGRPSERRTTPAGREAVDTLSYTEAEIARLLHAALPPPSPPPRLPAQAAPASTSRSTARRRTSQV